jgi:proteasome assembly chaperone (PAC2) family protein
MDEILYFERPNLVNPYLIVGFEGWPNAAEVSSSTLQYLIDHLKAKKFASLPMDKFCQTSNCRPTATIKEGRLVELRLPSNHFFYSKHSSSHDLIFFYGIEPHQEWSHFADLVLGLAERFDVSQLFTIGGTYDYIPHTYPPMVSALFNQEEMREKVIQSGLGLTEYTGPISIHTFLLEAARKKGLKAMSLWGHAPHYLQTKNVRVVCSVLKRWIDLTGMEIDLSGLEGASHYFDQQVNHLVEQDPKLQEVISKLEEAYRNSQREASPKAEEESSEDKVVYIQAFLRKPEDDGKKEGSS